MLISSQADPNFIYLHQTRVKLYLYHITRSKQNFCEKKRRCSQSPLQCINALLHWLFHIVSYFQTPTGVLFEIWSDVPFYIQNFIIFKMYLSTFFYQFSFKIVFPHVWLFHRCFPISLYLFSSYLSSLEAINSTMEGKLHIISSLSSSSSSSSSIIHQDKKI